MSKIFILLLMIFCHIVNDFCLQGWLQNGKQREWWKQNAPSELYKYDYIVALIMHSMSWSFMMLLPVAIHYQFDVGVAFTLAFVINAIVHGVVDHYKANVQNINLITDQVIHLLQIIITAECLVM